jgi:hypothetical protein
MHQTKSNQIKVDKGGEISPAAAAPKRRYGAPRRRESKVLGVRVKWKWFYVDFGGKDRGLTWNYVELRGWSAIQIPAIPGISGIFRDIPG